MARDYPLLVGACGWSHLDWQAEFYPQDLPDDWRLSYYANEFPVVLVTAQEWLSPEADATHWCDETEASFRFVVEISANSIDEVEAQLRRATAFGERCVGCLLRTSLSSDEIMLENLLDSVVAFSPLCVDFGNDAPADSVLNLLRRKQTNWCWHGNNEPVGLIQGSFAVTRIMTNDVNPREIRFWVETCLAAGNEKCQKILLFDGKPPNIEVIRQAQIILDLL